MTTPVSQAQRLKITYISSSDYGNKEYYAKWLQCEAGYETSENTWVYGTFLTALSNVYNGSTIKLFKDVTYSGLLSISKNITLKTDGNPRTLTINDYINVTDGSLTIDSADLTITGGNNSYQLIYNGSNGTVNIKSGTVSSVSAYCIYNLGTLNILSGEIIGSFVGVTVINNNVSGTVTITGGNIISSSPGGSAILEDVNATGLITISGTPVISSATDRTIECMMRTIGTTDTAVINYFGVTIYDSSMSNIL